MSELTVLAGRIAVLPSRHRRFSRPEGGDGPDGVAEPDGAQPQSSTADVQDATMPGSVSPAG